MPRRRTFIAGLAAGLLLPVVAVVAANAVVLLGSRDDPVTTPRGAAPAPVAIVLGAQVLPDGRMSPMLADRVAAGAQLYREGKVGKVLASGDHGTRGYDEVNAMRRGLIAAGVPERDVFTDHAGFDTRDSMIRARKVFGVRQAIVVTQRFHLPRALWIGERAGLRVEGVAADRQSYGRAQQRSTMREWLARTKAVGEQLVGRQPRFLGPQIPITGDGRATRG